MIDKLFLILFTFGITRITLCINCLVKRQKDVLKETINRYKDPPLPPLFQEGTIETNHFLAKKKLEGLFYEDLKKASRKMRSLDRLAYWEIVIWVLLNALILTH